MTRYYSVFARAWFTLLLVSAPSGVARAQTAPAERERSMLSSEITAQALEDLPGSSNLYQVLETIQADLISDRMDTGGLGMGQPARIGAHGSSWTQTMFRVGDVNVTDPSGNGSPMFMPGVMEWQRVDVYTGLMPADVNAPGLAITLTPRRPSKTWTRRIEGFFAPSPLVAGRSIAVPAGSDPATAWMAAPPPIERIQRWQDASLMLSGPLSGRTGILFAANAGSSRRFERYDPSSLGASIQSAFAHIVFAPKAGDELRIVVAGQRTSYAYPHHVAFGQPEATLRAASGIGIATYERRRPDGSSWRGFASWQARNRHAHIEPTTTFVMDRLRQGPVNELLQPGNGTEQTFAVGGRLDPPGFSRLGREHRAQLGVEARIGVASSMPSFTGRIGELVNGLPARAWDFTGTGTPSSWRATTLAAFATDRLQLLPRVVADLGLRFEHAGGSAAGADQGIAWNDLFPRAGLRWDITRVLGLAAFAGYGRYGWALPLNWLAYGDPNAPSGAVYRWTGAGSRSRVLPSDVGPLVARVGPGTGGDPGFSAIDPQLKRPHSDEVTFGFEARPGARTVMRLTASARRDSNIVGLVNTAVPESSYGVTYVHDDGYEEISQELPGYNRSPATFGLDRFLLANGQRFDPADETTHVGIDITGQTQTERFYLLLGATAGRAEGLAGNRGFQPNENDYGVIGEVLANPNARVYAQGRDFTERGYTLKVAAAYAFPWDLHVGTAARYQDGEHFTRNVIFEALNQGPEAVRAFRNGRTRFTFVMTIDTRVRKGFRIGGRRIEAILDAYNLFNQQIQVEEYDVSSPVWRRTTAVQPPRVVHLGLRLDF
ncbi:MAG: TonB-dependent receptor [Acidobacteria bacterium]|nr:TonB-dependent receptor [Acidobacteriota bacterium]